MRGHLRLDLADNCNIRCIMCQLYNSQPASAMRFVDFERFVAQTRGQLGPWSRIQLGNVAEPTVHPRFADYLRYIRSESDATIQVVTNGRLLRRYAGVINEVGNCLVQVSMDSVNKATHEYIREGSDYDRVIAGLNLLDTARNRILLSFTLMNSNIGEYGQMVMFCRERGYLMSAFPLILRDEMGAIPMALLRESLWFNIEKLQEWHRRYYHTEFDRVGQGEDYEYLGEKADEQCNAHQRDLVINSAGNAVLCGKQGLGSLWKTPLEELWNCATAHEFRQRVEVHREPCVNCDYRQRCLAPSMLLFENHFSDNIVAAVKPATRRAIAADRRMSNAEALRLFLHDISDDFGVFDLARHEAGYTARRITPEGTGESFQAATRHELQKAISASVKSKYIPRLLQTCRHHNIVEYMGQFWALPLIHASLDVRRQPDREHPDVIVADTLPRILEVAGRIGSKYEMVLVRENYKSHNVVQYLGKYWALPLLMGHVNLTDADARAHPDVFSADTLQEALAAIDALGRKYEMEVVQEGYKLHNIVRYLGQFWGLPLVLGQIDLTKEEDRARSGVIRTTSLHATLAAIDALESMYDMIPVEQGYRLHNIVSYLGRFWGLPLALGHVNLMDEADRCRPEITSAGTLEELRAKLDETAGNFEAVTVSEGYCGHNIVRFLGRYWGLPLVLGHVNLADPQLRERPEVIVADTLHAVRAAIDWAPVQSHDKGIADSSRWLKASPQTDIAHRHDGYRVVRYEFKFFAIPERHDGFDYADFLAGKYGTDVIIAHSMAELKAAIERAHNPAEGASVLFMPYAMPADGLANQPPLSLAAWDVAQKAGNDVIVVNAPGLFDWARTAGDAEVAALRRDLHARGARRACIPWRYPESWHDSSLEALAAKLVDVVEIVQPSGARRSYEGENLHRLMYNKAYLCSMFSVVPQPTGRNVLEVGCSDGLVCDIFAQLGAAHVTGVDVMGTVGCGFRDPRISYHAMDAASLDFPDQSFDITYSIATFEHLPDPCKVLSEMLRVTRIGGYCYVQAAPLYHSPFGHHMFAYFQDYPWVHLRRTPAEIFRYMLRKGIDRRVEKDHAISCESYLREMLSRDHVNGLFLGDFKLETFSRRTDIELLKLHTSYEGRDLLTDEIIAEIPTIHPERLVEHGFEIAFRRIA